MHAARQQLRLLAAAQPSAAAALALATACASLPTCAPTFGPTFFSDPTVTSCYSSRGNRTANYTTALQQCQAQGGSLAAWSSAEEQLMAEQYFSAKRTLPKYYWLGIRRLTPSGPYQRAATNGSVPQLATGPNSPGAYAHWAWLQPAYAGLPSYHCSLAWVDLAYEGWAAFGGLPVA